MPDCMKLLLMESLKQSKTEETLVQMKILEDSIQAVYPR